MDLHKPENQGKRLIAAIQVSQASVSAQNSELTSKAGQLASHPSSPRLFVYFVFPFKDSVLNLYIDIAGLFMFMLTCIYINVVKHDLELVIVFIYHTHSFSFDTPIIF